MRAWTLKREWIYGWLLLLPAMVFLFAFTHVPAVTTLINSFFSTPRGRRPAKFLGLANCTGVNDFHSAPQPFVGAALVAHLGGEFLFPGQVAHDP